MGIFSNLYTENIRYNPCAALWPVADRLFMARFLKEDEDKEGKLACLVGD